MLKILIERKWKKSEYSIGRLYVNGDKWCNSLEPTDRGLVSSMPTEQIKQLKVEGKTAIPLGKYIVTMTYSPKFRKELPLINDIKCFSRVLIHAGNYPKDTKACIIPGLNSQVGMVTNSTYWTNRLIDKIRDAVNHGEIVTLEIK